MASGLRISVSSNAKQIARKLSDEAVKQAAAKALTTTAAAARREINAKIPTLFRSVTPRTAKAVRYRPADPEKTLGEMQSEVYVDDWKGKKGKGVSPAQYLRAQIVGGTRRDKRSEVSLKNAGNMGMGQQWVPGDAQGPGAITGGVIVQILSQTRSFGEQGYRANATARSLKKLRESGVPVHRTLLTTYFVARDKRSKEPIGIYRLVGKGHVEEVLRFVDRRPQYQVRFPFRDLVAESIRANWPKMAQRALQEALRNSGP